MTDIEQKSVLMVLADISGYTRFMLANEKSLAHSQLIIGELINTLLAQVELPLTLAKLEGDALFLYAVKGADWERVRGRISERLIAFFHAFGVCAAAPPARMSSPCASR